MKKESTGIKYILTTLAVAAVLMFWVMFTVQSGITTSSVTGDNSQQMVVSNEIQFEFSAIPTLVSADNAQTVVSTDQTVAAQPENLRYAAAPAPVSSSTIPVVVVEKKNNASASVTSNNNKPVTTTKSS